MNNFNEESALETPLHLDQNARSFLLETCKWARFLSILGFIGIGFMVIGGIVFGSFMGLMASKVNSGAEQGILILSGGMTTVIYVIIAIMYTFPVLYLFRFSTKTKYALLSENMESLNSA